MMSVDLLREIDGLFYSFVSVSEILSPSTKHDYEKNYSAHDKHPKILQYSKTSRLKHFNKIKETLK